MTRSRQPRIASACRVILVTGAAGMTGCAHVDHLVHVFFPRSAPAMAPAPAFTDSEFELGVTGSPVSFDEIGLATAPQPRQAPDDALNWTDPESDLDESDDRLSAPAGDLELLLRVLDDLVQEAMRTQESLLRLHVP